MAVVRPPLTKPGSFLQIVFDLLQELPGLVSDRVQLLTLELRRARSAFGQIVALGVVAALLALTAWFALWIGLALAAVHAGLAWGWMLLLVLLINIGGAWAAVARMRHLAGYLALPATVRRLTVAPPAAVPMPESAAHASAPAATGKPADGHPPPQH